MAFDLPLSTDLDAPRISDRRAALGLTCLDVGTRAAWCVTKSISKPIHAVHGMVTAAQRRAMA